MWKDPIIEEIRQIRKELAAEFNYDVKAMLDDARRRQHESGHRVVSFMDPVKAQPPEESSQKK